MTSPLADLINRAKFYLNRVRGFDSVKGRIPHKKEKLPLTHGLNYRLACDKPVSYTHLTLPTNREV